MNDKIIVTDNGFELYQNNELTSFKSADDIDYKERLDEVMPVLERPVIMSLQEEKEEILKSEAGWTERILCLKYWITGQVCMRKWKVGSSMKAGMGMGQVM